MRKISFLTVVYIILTLLTVRADSWDDFSSVDRMWDGQKSITNKEFEQVIEKLEEKSNQKEEKKQKKRFKKIFGGGTTLHSELNPDNDIQEIEQFKSKEEGLLVNIPVQIYIDEKVFEKGYYKIIGERDSETNKLYAKFYQSQFFKGQVELTETEDDFGEETLDFARILPYNESFVKLIFGSVDFNAFAYIPFVE